jgi:hypothetical protein
MTQPPRRMLCTWTGYAFKMEDIAMRVVKDAQKVA